jgi:hypothetical protein
VPAVPQGLRPSQWLGQKSATPIVDVLFALDKFQTTANPQTVHIVSRSPFYSDASHQVAIKQVARAKPLMLARGLAVFRGAMGPFPILKHIKGQWQSAINGLVRWRGLNTTQSRPLSKF